MAMRASTGIPIISSAMGPKKTSSIVGVASVFAEAAGSTATIGSRYLYALTHG